MPMDAGGEIRLQHEIAANPFRQHNRQVSVVQLPRADKEGVYRYSALNGLADCAVCREYSIKRFLAKAHPGYSFSPFREAAVVRRAGYAPAPEAPQRHAESAEAESHRLADPHQPATPQVDLQRYQ
jgi:hypothetical protein